MSTENIAAMSPEEAQQAFMAHVFVPELVKTCAARGYAPQNEADLEALIKIALHLNFTETVKNNKSNLLQKAASFLDNEAAKVGISFDTPNIEVPPALNSVFETMFKQTQTGSTTAAAA